MSIFTAARFRQALRHFLLGRVAQGLVALAFTLISVRVMVPTEYGIYLLVLAVVEFLRPVSSLGMLPVVQQYLPEMAMHARASALRSFLGLAKALRWLLLLIFLAALYWGWSTLARLLGFDASVDIRLVSCLVIAGVLGTEFSEQLLEAILDQKYAQILRVGHALLRLSALCAFAVTDAVTLEVVLWIEAIAALICLVGSEILLVARLRMLGPDGTREFSGRDMFRFGLHMSTMQVLNGFSTAGAVRIVVARILGVEAAGQFGFLQTLLSQANRLLPSLLLVNLIRPMLIAARVRGDHQLIGDAYALLSKANMLLVWPLWPMAILVGDEVVALLSGERFQDAGIATAGLLMALASMTQLQVNSILLQVHHESKALVLIAALALLVPVLVAAGAKLQGLEAAAFGMSLAVLIRNLASARMLARVHMPRRDDATPFIVLAIAAAFAGGLLLAPWSSVLSCVLYLLMLLLSLPLVKPLSSTDARLLRAVSRNRLKWMRRFTRRKHGHR